VTGWVQGVRPNLGFLLVATSLGGDRVPVRFSRRGETVDSKQPNLVLFTEDSTLEPIPPYREKRVKFGKEVKGTTPGGPDGDALRNDTTTNTVEESERDDEEGHPISTSSKSTGNPLRAHELMVDYFVGHRPGKSPVPSCAVVQGLHSASEFRESVPESEVKESDRDRDGG